MGQGFALATINVDHLQRLGEEAPFRKAYAAQDLVCADGNPIVWLSRIAGKPVSLAPGSDLVLPLAHEAAAQGLPISVAAIPDEPEQGGMLSFDTATMQRLFEAGRQRARGGDLWRSPVVEPRGLMSWLERLSPQT